MKKMVIGAILCGLGGAIDSPAQSQILTREAATVEEAATIMHEIMSIPARKIPEAMLADAQAVAVIPNVVKGSFVVGIRHGRGIVVIRDMHGVWQLPIFITLTGGSVGWQAGLQATDVILVFKTRQSVDGLLRGKFTVGVDAAVAAGPLGRQATAATDAQLKAEILSYSRSRGLFAGVSLAGSVLRVDSIAGQLYYGTPQITPEGITPNQVTSVPPSSVELTRQIIAYASSDPLLATDPTPLLDTPEVNTQRSQLANLALHLYSVLDESWQRYLALPVEVFQGHQAPNHETLQLALSHFDTVAANPKYRNLSTRPEFQRTHSALQQYLNQFPRKEAKLTLPPPPTPDRQLK